MADFNAVMMFGRLLRDPKLRSVKGVPICHLNMAMNRGRKSSHADVTVYRRLAEICAQFLRRGSKVFVAGRLDRSEKGLMRVTADNVQFISSPSGTEADRP